MITQPPISQFLPPFGFVPIQQPLWRYCCAQADAQAILAKVSVLASDAALIDGLNENFPVSLIYMDAITKVWVIKGTVTIGGTTFKVNEFAGDLIDRMTKPNTWIDGQGGPNLKATDAGNGFVQLTWGQ